MSIWFKYASKDKFQVTSEGGGIGPSHRLCSFCNHCESPSWSLKATKENAPPRILENRVCNRLPELFPCRSCRWAPNHVINIFIQAMAALASIVHTSYYHICFINVELPVNQIPIEKLSLSLTPFDFYERIQFLHKSVRKCINRQSGEFVILSAMRKFYSRQEQAAHCWMAESLSMLKFQMTLSWFHRNIDQDNYCLHETHCKIDIKVFLASWDVVPSPRIMSLKFSHLFLQNIDNLIYSKLSS